MAYFRSWSACSFSRHGFRLGAPGGGKAPRLWQEQEAGRTRLLAQSPWTLSGHWSGWLILGLFTLAEAVVGRSLILGYEQLVFVGM